MEEAWLSLGAAANANPGAADGARTGVTGVCLRRWQEEADHLGFAAEADGTVQDHGGLGLAKQDERRDHEVRTG